MYLGTIGSYSDKCVFMYIIYGIVIIEIYSYNKWLYTY